MYPVCICMYVSSVCIYLSMHAFMYKCIYPAYAHMYVSSCIYVGIMYASLQPSIHMNACNVSNICFYVCMYACMYPVYVCIHICMHSCICVCIQHMCVVCVAHQTYHISS